LCRVTGAIVVVVVVVVAAVTVAVTVDVAVVTTSGDIRICCVHGVC
jgi:hypothetical protein